VKPRRVLFVVALIAVVAGAVAAGNATVASTAAPSAPSAAAALPAAPASTVWFCTGAPPAIAAGDGVVTFSNTDTATAQIDLTILPDKGQPVRQSFSLPGATVVRKARAQLGLPGALTVETFGGRVVVEEGIEGKSGLESTPCATQASAHWFFAAGTTPRGVQQWLVLDNPYASGARVNIMLRTGDGVHEPQALQGVHVPRRSRVVVPLHSIVVREDRVATEVDATLGRVVAEQTLVFTTDAVTPGVATTLGAPESADHWWFAGGASAPGVTGIVAITNVGSDNAQVGVQAVPAAGAQAPPPTQLTIAQDDVVWVQLGNCSVNSSCVAVPSGQSFALDVHSDHGVAIVAQTLWRYSIRDGELGATSVIGMPNPSATWLFGRSIVTGEKTTTLAVVNPLAQAAQVGVALVSGGSVTQPPALQHVTVPAGGRATLVIIAPSKRPPSSDAAMVVTSSSPVVVERTIVGASDTSSGLGVPIG